MKKLILMFAVIAAVSFTSCKKDKKEEVKTEAEKVKDKAEEVFASNDVLHQCPMNCEKGKSYTEPGKCPVCKMDLKEKKVHVDGKTCDKCGKDKAECTCNHDDYPKDSLN